MAATAAALQDLNYVYDAAGNLTSIRDHAQQTVFFANTQVEPHNDYTYDALYRLIEARRTGTGGPEQCAEKRQGLHADRRHSLPQQS